MLVLRFALSQHVIVKKLQRIFNIYSSKFQNLPTFMKPSSVLRMPRDQGFHDPAPRLAEPYGIPIPHAPMLKMMQNTVNQSY